MEDEVAIETCSGEMLFLKLDQIVHLISTKETI